MSDRTHPAPAADASFEARALAGLALLIVGCLFAGAYGALHNQISCTVSPEYFTHFKFEQFGIGDALPLRTGAALIGWMAAWWMGLIIGVPVVGLSFRHSAVPSQIRGTLLSFAAVVVTALAVGLMSLAHGYVAIGPDSLPSFWYPEGLSDPVAFARAGHMHNFSYLGGLLGIATGSVVQWRLARRRATPSFV